MLRFKPARGDSSGFMQVHSLSREIKLDSTARQEYNSTCKMLFA